MHQQTRPSCEDRVCWCVLGEGNMRDALKKVSYRKDRADFRP